MNVIITMAGEGRRFQEAGIATPKPMIEVKGKSLFEWAVGSLKNFYDHPFFFLSRQSMHASSFIEEKARALGISAVSVKEIPGLTRGQAETVLLAEDMVQDLGDPILIYNIDTFVEPEYLKPEDIRGDGWVPAFRADGDHWSFVRLDEESRVLEITEKVRISEYGTIGLYYFSSFNVFKNLYEKHPFELEQERYVAPLYRLMLEDLKLEVYSSLIPKEAVHVLGTPEEVRQFDPEWNPKTLA
ncbi:MAG: glycosyltransferase family 2 protein [bacterium]|nr:glycosyltransferase family 2 protein [bacterium]